MYMHICMIVSFYKMYIYMYMSLAGVYNIYIYIYRDVYTYKHMCVYIYIYICTYIYIYMYICISCVIIVGSSACRPWGRGAGRAGLGARGARASRN